jgi:TRAP-type C4-dicarboxylate transport system substrate-binding protein
MPPEFACAGRSANSIRKLGDDAVPEMRKRGLNVITVDEANFAGWREEADKAYPKLRGVYAPADLFDEVQRLRDEFRRQGASSGAVAGEATGSRDPE